MQYRLLRNNKESGPYTKAQLEEMGLKPYDLLWIEGRGGAWQYASEISDLKSIAPVVEEQPYDRFYKGKEKASNSTSNNTQTATVVKSTNSSQTATLKAPKPRFRISGDKIIMIDDAGSQQQLQQSQQATTAVAAAFTKTQQPVAVAAKPAPKQEIAAHVQSVGMDWEEMYTDWKGEDKEVAEKPAPDKAQTMEEVRQRYEEAKLKQLGEKHNKTASAAKQNIMAAIAILVLAVGGYAGYKLNNGSTATQRTTQAAPVEKAEVVQDNNGLSNNGDETVANTLNTAQQTTDNGDEAGTGEINNALPATNTEPKTAEPLPVENKVTAPEVKKEQSTPAKNTATTSAEKPNVKEVQQETAAEKNKTTSTNNNVSTPVKDNQEAVAHTDVKKQSNDVAAQEIPVAPPVVKHEAPAKKIGDYIAVNKLGSSNSASVQNVLLSVKNVTDFPIDLAVIDIQYYGENGRLQKGETMYVKNIGAGSNVNVRIPDGKTAKSISYKVSLVSSEQKTLYLVGE